MSIEGGGRADVDAARKKLPGVAAMLPQYPFVGWDLIMTSEGLSFLEGNALMGTWTWHDPLLDDPRARAFFENLVMIRG